MYPTDVIWWTYTAFLLAATGFMVWFVNGVRRKGGEP